MESIDMQTANPLKGLRLLRNANVLSVVSVFLAIVGGIVMVISAGVGIGMEMDGNSAASGMVLAAGIGGLVAIVSGVLVLVAGVMEIVALVKTSSIHPEYKNALMWVVVSMVFSVIIFFMPTSGTLATIIGAVPSIFALLKVYFVIGATTALLTAKGDTQVATKGEAVRKTYIICTVIMLVAELAALIPVLNMAVSLVTLVVSIVQLVALFRYIGFLGSAVKVFEA